LRFSKISLAIFILIFSIILSVNTFNVWAVEPEPSVSSSAEFAIIIDIDKGQVLFEKQADKQFSALLLSKLMTALISIEKLPPNSNVTVSANAAAAQHHEVTLESGNIYKLDELLAANLLAMSDNSATALFEAVESNPEEFVKLMNSKVTSLSMNSTKFDTPLGRDEDSYTTVRDMSNLMINALNTQPFRDIFCSTIRFINTLSMNPRGYVRNTNEVLFNYEWAKGGCLLSTDEGLISSIIYANRNDMNLLQITINSSVESYIEESISMFDYCFFGFEKTLLVAKGEVLDATVISNESLPLIAANDVFYISPKGKNIIKSNELLLIENVSTPIEEGSYMGSIKYTLTDGTTISVSVQAGSNIYSSSAALNDILEALNSNKDIVTLIMIISSFIAIIIISNSWHFFSKKISRKQIK